MGVATNYTDIVMTEVEKANSRKSVRPNAMTFTDADGQKHSIHIPAEKYDQALQYFVEKDWNELKKFDKWGMSQSLPYTGRKCFSSR